MFIISVDGVLECHSFWRRLPHMGDGHMDWWWWHIASKLRERDISHWWLLHWLGHGGLAVRGHHLRRVWLEQLGLLCVVWIHLGKGTFFNLFINKIY